MKNYWLQIIIIVVFLTGCGQENPLFGKWKEKKTLFTSLSGEIITLEFTKEEMKSQLKTVAVEYKIQDENNILLFSDGAKLNVKLVDEQTIFIQYPGGYTAYYIKENK